MSRLRVTLFSHTYLAEIYRGKLEALADHVDLTLVTPRTFPWSFAMKDAKFSGAEPYAVRTYPLKYPLSSKTSTRWILSSRDLGFRGSPPDILHVENEPHSFSLIQALVCRRLYAPKAKVVVFTWANLRLNGLKGLALNAITRLTLRQIDFVIAGNAAGKSLLLQGGVPDNRIAVVPQSGIDRGAISTGGREDRLALRRELGIAPQEFVLGYVGRFVAEKGIADAIAAVRRLRKESASLRLLCVGEGPLRPELTAALPDVIVASPGAGPQVMQYYLVMDALILPSRSTPTWQEQFGRVIIEAMASGVPVIGSDSGAIPEVIGDAGLIYPEGDIERLTEKLTELVLNPVARAQWAARGRARVESSYVNDVIARQTVEVYNRLS